MTVLPDGRDRRRSSRIMFSLQIAIAVVAVLIGLSTMHSAQGHLIIAGGFGLLWGAIQLRHSMKLPLEIISDEEVSNAMERAITLARAFGHGCGTLMVEIDGFADLSEQQGAATQQQIQIMALARLKANLKQSDSLYWIGPGQFAVVLSPYRSPDLERCLQVASKLQASLTAPHPIGGNTFYLTASVGCCMTSRLPNATGTLMLSATRLALREALASGAGAVRVYTSSMDDRAAEKARLAHDLIRALEHNEIRAYFQPQISLRTGQLTGFEALARWQHPVRGLIPPNEFLPLIESAGLLGRLGERIMDDALILISEWNGDAPPLGRVGINFSLDELRDPSLPARIKRHLARRDVEPSRLNVEVLETVVASRANDAVEINLAELARLGCGIDLDDFGTGSASITNILRFSIERIKIDRSFVRDIDKDPANRSMVAAILTMAERLGLDTLAEGAETEAELRMLTELGCGHVQGFAIGRPMPRDETELWAKAYMAGRSSCDETNRFVG